MDISIRGLWQPQTVALLDVRVVDTDAVSHIHQNTSAVLSSAEEEKKRKYNSAAEARRASVTPFVVFTECVYVRVCVCMCMCACVCVHVCGGYRQHVA